MNYPIANSASSSSAFVGAFPIPPSPFHPSAVSFSGLSSGFPALAVNLLPLASESRPHPTPVVFVAPSPFRPHLAPAVFLAPCSLPRFGFRRDLLSRSGFRRDQPSRSAAEIWFPSRSAVEIWFPSRSSFCNSLC
ncbi:hypothetical protein ACLOJK_036569 [Asimina triloba]